MRAFAITWLAVSLAAGGAAANGDSGDEDDLQSLWASYLSHFESSPSEGAWRCSTLLVEQLRERWHLFSPQQRVRMTAHIAPWKDDLLEPASVETTTPTTREPEDTCWGQKRENRVTGTHFVVEWDSENVSQEDAEAFLEALETSWEVEVDQLGWQAPPLTDDYYLAAYIEDPGPDGGYTSTDDCGNLWMPYIVAGTNAFTSDWYLGMASHEFNHAMQFGYGRALERYWWEASAMYVEPFVFPEEDHWIDYILGYSTYPWLALNSSSNNHDDPQFIHMYGMVILAVALDQYAGDADLVRQTWEASQDYVEDYGLSMAELLPVLGYDWDGAYRSFMAANTVMDYGEWGAFPAVTLQETVDELPASGTDSADTAPQTLGQNYIRFDASCFPDGEADLRVAFRGPSHAEWIVLVVGTSGGEVQQVLDMELDTGQGESLLPDAGQYDQVFLVVSPGNHAGDGMHYEWEAEALFPGGDDDDSAADDDDSGSDDDDDSAPGDDDVEEEDGCACRVEGQASPFAAWFLLGLHAVALYRRSR